MVRIPHFRRLALLAALFAVPGGCVRTPEPPAPAPVARPAAPLVSLPEPAPAADWRDWPLTPGTWTYGRDSRGTRAMFGVAGTDAALVLRCDAAARRLYLSRAGAGLTPVNVRTSSTSRALAVRPTGGSLPYVAAELGPEDRLLDAIAFSRGRFVIEQAGAPALVVPAWAEAGRVIEDCRGA